MNGESPPDGKLSAPWADFLQDVSNHLSRPVEIHCLGGFVLHVMYSLPRPTGDVDFITAAPRDAVNELMGIAGRGTPLARKHQLYMELAAVADFPDDYDSRLIDIAPGTLANLRLRALSTEDLVLAKLTRNSPKDVYDVRFLAGIGAIDRDVLRARYQDNLRPYLVNTERHDLTLELWIEEIDATANKA
jgi:hypothetical protein